MSATPNAGSWRQDPTGRFGYRWHDGADWTDIVVGANGQQTTDTYPRDVQPALPPPSPATASDSGWQPPGQTTTLPATTSPWEPQAPSSGDSEWDVPAAPAPRTVSTAPDSAASSAWRTQVSMAPTPAGTAVVRTPDRVVVAIVVGAIGLVAVALSLFALDWQSGGGFLDLRREVVDTLEGPVVDVVLKLSLQYVSFAVLGVTAVLTALVLLGDRSRGLRTAAAFAAGIGAVLHTFTVARPFRGVVDPELGAWLGTAGYLVVLVALGIDAVRRGD